MHFPHVILLYMHITSYDKNKLFFCKIGSSVYTCIHIHHIYIHICILQRLLKCYWCVNERETYMCYVYTYITMQNRDKYNYINLNRHQYGQLRINFIAYKTWQNMTRKHNICTNTWQKYSYTKYLFESTRRFREFSHV